MITISYHLKTDGCCYKSWVTKLQYYIHVYVSLGLKQDLVPACEWASVLLWEYVYGHILLVDFQDFCLKKMGRRVEIKKVTKNYPNNIGSVGQNKKKDTKGPHRTSEQQ